MQFNLNILGIFFYSFSNHICNFIKLFHALHELATNLYIYKTEAFEAPTNFHIGILLKKKH